MNDTAAIFGSIGIAGLPISRGTFSRSSLRRLRSPNSKTSLIRETARPGCASSGCTCNARLKESRRHSHGQRISETKQREHVAAV